MLRLRLALVLAALPTTAAALVLAAPSTAAHLGAVPRAVCGPQSNPETGLQGQVPLADRLSGRSATGYACNVVRLGRYQGAGSSWVSASTGPCAYLPQAAGARSGVQVVDVRTPSSPRPGPLLQSPAFSTGTWESLKLHEGRRLLAGSSGGALEGVAAFDVYDVSDCLRPRLLNSVGETGLSLPANTLGHEGGFSPDGRTYWSTGGAPGVVTAIDVSDPRTPSVLWTGNIGIINHGVSFSADGRLLHLSTVEPQGLTIVDVSSVQDRRALPRPTVVSSITWADGDNAQHSVPITYGGRRHLLAVDEMAQGAVRFLDVHDPRRPRTVSRVRLEIQQPEHAQARADDTAGTGLFGYEAHYCAVDRPVDPTLAACAFFQSGIRVFDIRDPRAVREVAYYNPRAQVGQQARLTGSEHASGATRGTELTADWCSSPPRFVGRDQLWVACQDNGFLVLRLTNGVR